MTRVAEVAKGHAAGHRRVHPPLADPRPAPSRQIALQSPAGQRMASSASATTASWPVPPARPTSRRSGTCLRSNSRRSPTTALRSSRSPYVNPVRIAVALCASSRPSGATNAHQPAHRHGPRPDDGTRAISSNKRPNRRCGLGACQTVPDRAAAPICGQPSQ